MLNLRTQSCIKNILVSELVVYQNLNKQRKLVLLILLVVTIYFSTVDLDEWKLPILHPGKKIVQKISSVFK